MGYPLAQFPLGLIREKRYEGEIDAGRLDVRMKLTRPEMASSSKNQGSIVGSTSLF